MDDLDDIYVCIKNDACLDIGTMVKLSENGKRFYEVDSNGDRAMAGSYVVTPRWNPLDTCIWRKLKEEVEFEF
ncbi:MAG: hypothetical protein RR744_00330 [Cellulosilyticaceae bacterium]